MCHLVLIMPVLALPIFWLLPGTTAVLVYSVVLALSGLVYLLAIQAMRKPVMTGSEEIVKSIGEVIESQKNSIRVRVHSEIWNAKSVDDLHVGDRVNVVSMKGLTLKVRRITD